MKAIQLSLLQFTSHFILVDSNAPIVNCIEDVISEIGFNIGGTVVSWTEPTATDNSGVVNLASRSRAPGSFFVVGNSEVTYVFVDGNGNRASCTFTVSVLEGKITICTIHLL